MIVSVRRRKGSYLPHITRLLHQQIAMINSRKNKKNGKRDVDVIICNSDAEPTQNKEAVYLSNFIDVISINRTKRSHKGNLVIANHYFRLLKGLSSKPSGKMIVAPNLCLLS